MKKQKSTLSHAEISTIVGRLVVTADTEHIHNVFFAGHEDEAGDLNGEEALTPLLEKAIFQLEDYFSGKRQLFDLPLIYSGTPFQNRVWQQMMRIPYGTVLSYGELGARLGNPNLARAVGQAANKNRIPVIIPCHRVVGAGGQLGGFEPGFDLKKILLELENAPELKA